MSIPAATPLFSDRLRHLFRQVGLPVPAVAPGQHVYTACFSTRTTLHFSDGGDATLDVVAEAGSLEAQDPRAHVLLSLSPCMLPYPITLYCADRTVLLWTRVPLKSLDAKGFDRLIASMLTRVDTVRATLSQQSAPTAGISAASPYRNRSWHAAALRKTNA